MRAGVKTVRVRLTVAYDGTDFRGFAPQAGVLTVGGELERAIGAVLRSPVSLVCAGRTDAGVHAIGQVVSFDAPGGTDLERLAASVNRMLGPRIVVRDADHVAPDFDARRSAVWRQYVYTVDNQPVPDPLLARLAWHVPAPADLRALVLACDPIIGEHDFSAFCRRPKPASGSSTSMVRRVLDARWQGEGGGVMRFEIRAKSFCHQMVRSLVGTMVEMGTGRRRPGEMAGILRAGDRAHAGPVAPPQGLCLTDVGYP